MFSVNKKNHYVKKFRKKSRTYIVKFEQVLKILSFNTKELNIFPYNWNWRHIYLIEIQFRNIKLIYQMYAYSQKSMLFLTIFFYVFSVSINFPVVSSLLPLIHVFVCAILFILFGNLFCEIHNLFIQIKGFFLDKRKKQFISCRILFDAWVNEGFFIWLFWFLVSI